MFFFLIFLDDPSLVMMIWPINTAINASILTLDLFPTVTTVKGEVLEISIGDYLCVPSNPAQLLTLNTSISITCSLPVITIPGYYLLSLLIQNGGGLLINANSCRNLLIREIPIEYQVSFHPIIANISSLIGSSLGNFIEINGQGFMEPLIASYMDQILTIITMNSIYLYLEIPEIADFGIQDFYEGSPGCQEFLYEKVYNFSDRELLINSIKPNISDNIMFLNTQPNSGNKGYTRLIIGLFKPPITSNYRFYCSGVEMTQLLISNISGSSNRKTLINACQNLNSSNEDEYFNENSQVSEWISLEENGLYYMEIMQINAKSANDQ